jgi:hypothetical protein
MAGHQPLRRRHHRRSVRAELLAMICHRSKHDDVLGPAQGHLCDSTPARRADYVASYAFVSLSFAYHHRRTLRAQFRQSAADGPRLDSRDQA